MYDIHELFHACEIGDIRRGEAFVEANNVDVDTQDSDDLTALQVAAANDQVKVKFNKIPKSTNMSNENNLRPLW